MWSRRRPWLSAGAGLLVGALLVPVLDLGLQFVARVGASQPAAPLSVAELPLEWSVDPTSSAAWGEMASSAVSLRSLVTPTDPRWLPAVLEVESLFFVKDARLECAERYAAPVEEKCAIRLSMVLERTDDERARIVFSEASLRSAEDAGLPPERIDANCEPYAACLARARLDAVVPVPDGDWTEYAVYESIQTEWGDPRLHQVEYLREAAQKVGRAVRAQSLKSNDGDVLERLRQESLRDHLRYMKAHIAKLEGDG